MSMSSADTTLDSNDQPNTRRLSHRGTSFQNTLMSTVRPRSSLGGVYIENLSMAELHQRLGNLQAQLTVKEDALNTEKRQTQRIRAERDDCRRQITELKHTVQQQNRTIKEQTHLIDDYEKKIEQQKRTIQVQSDTISGKQHASERGDRGDRVDRRLLMTPSHHRETQHTYQEDTPTAAPTARRVRISDQPPPPFPIRRSEPNDSRVPPNLRSQHSSNTQALVRYGDEAPPQPQQGLGSNLLALVPYDDTSSANTEYLAHLQYIFNLSEAWARNHANIPDASRDSRIPESVKATLETLSDLSLAPTLLRNANTRHFLVAKVINHCLAIEIFKIGIFKGFSNDTDHQLQLTKSRIFQNTPFAARKAMHHAIARTIIEMKMKSGFDAFQTAKADEHAGKLYAHLQHLVAPGTEQARRDLGELMRHAHQLTLDMYSLPLQFAFEFPGVGANFDPSCMVNHDPEVTGDPLGLQRRGMRIRLGVSPITVKWEVTAAAIVPQTIHYAKVLLMA